MNIYVYRLRFTNRFRRLDERDGLLIEGGTGWAEVSPFWDYDDDVAARWLAAGYEAAQRGYPEPIRQKVPVNETIPAVDAQTAYDLAAASSCSTFKVKIADHPESLAEDLTRLEAVRAAAPTARIRIDANGAWGAEEAVRNIGLMNRAAGGLEYVEQPCRQVDELAQVRRKVDVPIAADESIRIDGLAQEVVRTQAADLVVLKNQPLGGVRRALRLQEELGVPVVVSSAVESSVGLRAGIALAAALPELPYACGLATSRLFDRDITSKPLVPHDGQIEVRDVVPEFSEPVSAELEQRWATRLERMWEYARQRHWVSGNYEFQGGFR
ncbi:o-succinylbenzoate synthase [Trueperella bialowiezensis]|uniref:o-succinylbenzoate synthase n=1 Tax=Trueperella bialowiezensis TaxID=312285 RepID=A0A448PFI5_9ACTO|nr:o-succinylbenzoate synthase [Trueperella bialowiezensis]VEI13692.1 L-Ala-D/L-Glu epimerase [Trueperella bialowiezensis]